VTAPWPETLDTPRLHLRQLTDADLPTLVREIGRWEVAQWLISVPHPYTPADGQTWLGITRARRAGGDLLHMAVVPEGWTEMAGAVALDLKVHGADEPELGYWFAPAAWGRGYGSEAAIAMVDLAFRSLGVAAVQAAADPANGGSNGVLRKAGLRMVRVDPAHSRGLRGGPAPTNIWRITRAEWKDQGRG